jgi:hypothetical protein
MELLYRLLDGLDTWFTAGLFGAVGASWWHRDDLVDRKAWVRPGGGIGVVDDSSSWSP